MKFVLLQRVLEDPTMMLTAVVVGGAILWFYFSRRERPSAPAHPTPAAVAGLGQRVGSIAEMSLAGCRGWRICVAFETCMIVANGRPQFRSAEDESMLKQLAASCEVFLFARSSDATMRSQLSAVSSIPQLRVLQCTTEKGYEAFARQLKPSLFITADVSLGTFLSQFLQFVIVIDQKTNTVVGSRSNVALRKSLAALFH